jgi:glucose-1-phosphate thymidylyltransferase
VLRRYHPAKLFQQRCIRLQQRILLATVEPVLHFERSEAPTLLKKFNTRTEQCPEYENTVLIQPVSIGKGCTVKNSIVGPNVTIGDHTNVDYSIIKDSIIGAFSNLYDIVLDDSLIGSDTTIRGETRTLNIGDNTDIDLG